MNNLFFLSNRLLSPKLREEMRLPMHFISFAITDGQMFSTFGKHDTFVAKGLRKRENSVVYGALFVMEDVHFHVRSLDSMLLCSKSSLGRNHSLDRNHRVVDNITLISFKTLDELNRLMYKERETIPVQMYVANTTHPDNKQRIHVKHHYSHRIMNGVHEKYFIEQFGEVSI